MKKQAIYLTALIFLLPTSSVFSEFSQDKYTISYAINSTDREDPNNTSRNYPEIDFYLESKRYDLRDEYVTRRKAYARFSKEGFFLNEKKICHWEDYESYIYTRINNNKVEKYKTNYGLKLICNTKDVPFLTKRVSFPYSATDLLYLNIDAQDPTPEGSQFLYHTTILGQNFYFYRKNETKINRPIILFYKDVIKEFKLAEYLELASNCFKDQLIECTRNFFVPTKIVRSRDFNDGYGRCFFSDNRLTKNYYKEGLFTYARPMVVNNLPFFNRFVSAWGYTDISSIDDADQNDSELILRSDHITREDFFKMVVSSELFINDFHYVSRKLLTFSSSKVTKYGEREKRYIGPSTISGAGDTWEYASRNICGDRDDKDDIKRDRRHTSFKLRGKFYEFEVALFRRFIGWHIVGVYFTKADDGSFNIDNEKYIENEKKNWPFEWIKIKGKPFIPKVIRKKAIYLIDPTTPGKGFDYDIDCQANSMRSDGCSKAKKLRFELEEKLRVQNQSK